MTRTWNSWTHNGVNRDRERAGKANDLQPSWEVPSTKAARPAKGALESGALEQAKIQELKRAMDLSDVRLERVERIRRQLQAGTYKVSSRKLAEKLIRNMLGMY